MLDEFLQTLEQGPASLAYGSVAVASALEYIFPPIPGDTVTLVAVVLAVRAQLNWILVYVFMTLGALFGGVAAWGVGLWLAENESRWPDVLTRPRAQRAIDAVRRGYAKHGSMYLAVNRFLPALRAFFFVGAGLSRMRLGAVVLWGGLSAAAWNALLLGVGYTVGQNFDALQALFEQYTAITLAVVVVVALGMLMRMRTTKQA